MNDIEHGGVFGPPYHKIQTAFYRDERGIIIPDRFTLPEFEYLLDTPWCWTEKIDGTNIRVHFDGESITVGGRTDAAQIPGGLMFALADLNNPPAWREAFPDCDDVTLYGEGFGRGIQSGGQYRQDQGFILFDVLVRSVCQLHEKSPVTPSGRTMPSDSVSPAITGTSNSATPSSPSASGATVPPGDGRPKGARITGGPTVAGISSASTESNPTSTSASLSDRTGGAPSAENPNPASAAEANPFRSPSTTITVLGPSEDSSALDAIPASTRPSPAPTGSKGSRCTCANWWLKREDVLDVGRKLGLDVVPTYGEFPLRRAIEVMMDNLLASHWTGAQVEGLVGTPAVPLFTRKGDRIITKLKVKDFEVYSKALFHRAAVA